MPANFYFLIIAILSLTPVSPKPPVVSVAPLVFVLSVSAIKEAIEDYQRHKLDEEMNNTPVEHFNTATGKFEAVPWKAVAVGDVIRVTEASDAFPADIILLQSSFPQGMCNIETSNLDGETNLKIKQALGQTWEIACSANGNDYPTLIEGFLESESPNPRMDSNAWKGNIFVRQKDSSDELKGTAIGMNQLLLRGCTLRNTEWIIGLVVFTGTETKLLLNSRETPFKRSNVERIVDKALYILFIIQTFLCFLGMILGYNFKSLASGKAW
eukprot:877860_1